VTRSAAPILALAAVLVLAGCGEKRHSSSGSSGGSTTISESEFTLSPASAPVDPGGTITVKNDGKTTHALEIVMKSGHIKTKALSPGQSVQLQAPSKAGSYVMFCPIDHHRQMGMTGKLTVGSGGGGGGTSTSSKPSPAPSQSPGGY
jgi:plastocyanin